MNYDHKKIEPRWQKFWAKNKTFAAKDFSKKPKYYALDMFPYPSGAGLHVGHPLGYTATDIICRKRRHEGFEVLHPMGWDAFGLPAENYAIKTGVHPKVSTQANIKTFKKQIQDLGFSYDWDREIDSTDPNYFKWSQWIFLQLFKNGLAYEKEMSMNWCPKCRVVCANEEVESGTHERCGEVVERRNLKQWMLGITKYADRLLEDLDDESLDWPMKIKAMQKNWIGKSEGAEIDFEIDGFKEETITAFTTRPDTLFGATYFVLSPEHSLLEKIVSDDQKKEVKKYIKTSSNKSDMERTELNKDKTGVFTGAYVVNPVNNEKLPIWIADYVLMSYGTGAIMAVPAHDERDFEFAKKYEILIKKVVQEPKENKKLLEAIRHKYYIGVGRAINSGFLDGLKTAEAKQKMIKFLEKKGIGRRKINYKLRDWIFTRQRYWGEPIPLIHCKKCGVVPHDPEWAKYEKINTNKIEECPFPKESWCSCVTYANSSTFIKSISSRAEKVKFLYLKQNIKKIEKIKNCYLGEIILDIIKVKKHIRKKHFREVQQRFKYLPNVKEILESSDVICKGKNDKILVFGRFNDQIVQIVLEKEKQNWTVKTFYQSKQCSKCWQAMKEKYSLPLKLPETPNYEPAESGESPLAKITDWVNTECPKCGGKAKRETSTMPNWAGSSWYWLRFMDPKNDEILCDPKKEKYWGPVDLYVGGAEHAVLHLLYGRFWHKVLYDLKLVSTKEPFKKLVNQGLIMAEDGRKMSKSLGNVVNPDEVVEKYGADTLRVYEMFMGPFEQSKSWTMGAVGGTRKFLEKVFKIFQTVEIKDKFDDDKEFLATLHKTIKKVGKDIDNFKFNTAVSQLMICTNFALKLKTMSRESATTFITLISPFAPHLAEEIWSTILKNKGSIVFAKWPDFNLDLCVDETITYAVQINGKVRDEFSIIAEASKSEILEMAKAGEKAKKYLEGVKIKKEIFVPGRLVGFVI